MHLCEQTWTDAERARPDAVLVPVGSTEQHGPHAPLGTDSSIAQAVASRGAASTDMDVLVTPTIPIGIAEEHRHFAGTLWVRPETFRQYLRETIESVAHHGWDRIVVVNGHGGNVGALEETCASIQRGEDVHCVPFTWFKSIDLGSLEMGHGGAVETAALLAARPELVHQDRLEGAAKDAADRWGTWVRGVNLAVDSIEFTENGVVGDPAAATTECGEHLLEEAGDALVEVIEALVSAD